MFALSAFAAVLAVAALVAVFYDAPCPDDSDLRPVIKTVADEDNAMVVMRELSKTLKIAHEDFPELELTDGSSVKKFYSVLYSDLSGESEGDDRMVRLIIEKNNPAIALFFEAIKKPELQFGVASKEINDIFQDNHTILALINTMRLMQSRWKHKMQYGLSKEVMSELYLVRNFAQRYMAAPDGRMGTFLSGLSADAMCLAAAMQSLEQFSDKSICLEISHRLSREELNKDSFIKMMKGSYAFHEGCLRLREPGMYFFPPVSRSSWRYFYKLNMTRARLCQLTRDVIKDASNDISPVFDQATRETYENVDELRHIIRPNSSGAAIAVASVIDCETVYIRMLNMQAITRQIACAFALRAYWLDYHTLPKSLDVLVPAYMDSVPEDPFIKKPMQYDASKTLLYCAGPERLVDDGSFAFEEDAEPFGRRAFVILDWAKK
ncbi:hypothetical protein CKA38_11420 [Ereboglobus luteus]|uniref:Uncharacterized protein n=1 Tax=Ereboglobus luteus TaxID=1796921 RepID=A0A2U8E4B4_9BACT|nr:hypothetical protein CKA38_11420 [Ereboglobus luteus]